MSASDVAQSLLLLAPGFIYLKLLAVFGEQHRRLEWEWIVWSLIAALPIAVIAHSIRYVGDRVIPLGTEAWTSIELGTRFALAILLGLVSALAWRRVRRSTKGWAVNIRRLVNDSAWDVSLDDATRNGFGVEVTVTEGEGTATYYGKVGTFGYEAAGAEPWVYLRFVQRWKDQIAATRRWMPEPTDFYFTRMKYIA